MWLEKVYRKRLITSALRKDLLQIDALYARISKLRYELYDLKKEDWFELCGTCVACKDEGQRLELKEKEKWYVDEVKTVKAIVGTVVWTRTRLLKVEYKQWKSLRGYPRQGWMKIVWRSRGSAVGTRLIYIISHQERFLWKNARY